MTFSAFRRLGAGSLLLAGVVSLLVALGLAIFHGLILMGYEDFAETEAWAPGELAAWRADLAPAWRIAYWLSALGAPVALLAGGTLVALSLLRRHRARAADSAGARGADASAA